MSEEQIPDTTATDMNALLRLRRTTSAADLTGRLFGAPEPEPELADESGTTGGDAA